MKTRKHLPWDLVISLAVAVVGLGYVVQSAKRTIAAVSPSSPTGVRLSNEGEFIDVGCVDKQEAPIHVRRDRGPLRLKGRFCGGTDRALASESSGPSLRIRNLTARLEATVVLRDGGQSFLTSDMELFPGENVIEVEWHSSDRKKPARWTARISSI